MSAEKTGPTELQIKTDKAIRPGHIAWLDRNESPFAYTKFGGMGVPTGRAFFIVVHPDDYERAITALSQGEITF
jgi:hypothetical protein